MQLQSIRAQLRKPGPTCRKSGGLHCEQDQSHLSYHIEFHLRAPLKGNVHGVPPDIYRLLGLVRCLRHHATGSFRLLKDSSQFIRNLKPLDDREDPEITKFDIKEFEGQH